MAPNSWNALLESLHSALIDEFNERLPEEKPELGLPLKQASFAWPSPEIDVVVKVSVTLENHEGAVFLALGAACAKSLRLEAATLWEIVNKRAEAGFSRRGITPGIGEQTVWRIEDSSRVSKLGKIIWIPFRIQGAPCYLGVGI